VRVRIPGRTLAVAASLIAASAPAAAQPEPEKPPPADQPAPSAEQPAPPPASVEQRLDDLADKVEDLSDENEDLEDQVKDLQDQVTNRREPVRYNLMNPPITAFLNGAGRVDDRTVLSAGGTAIDDRMFLRTAEFDFRAAIDPYADGVAILALEDQAGEGMSADIEEGYMVIKRLPILESAPLGLKLKIGRFRAPIGSGNRLHMHDLPWTTRPLPIVELLGTEQGGFFESGFNPEGVDAEFLLPEIIPGAVMELNLDAVDGGDIAISGGGHRPGFLGHYNLFFTAADAHDVNLGVSGYYERGPHRAGLLAADFLYKWKPLRAGEFHSFVLGGEAFYGDRKFAIDTNDDGVPDMEARSKPLAGYGFAQYQLSWHLYAGARYDYAESAADDSLVTQVAAAYASYYTSEFLRFRVGYEHRWSDLPADDGLNSVLFEVNCVIGSHPTEPYWVNR